MFFNVSTHVNIKNKKIKIKIIIIYFYLKHIFKNNNISLLGILLI